MTTTKSREQQILDWAHTAFGTRTLTSITNKLFEETGEIAGQVNRLLEGRIGTHDTVLDEMGDALIVLSQMAGFFNTTLENVLTKRLAEVRRRTSDVTLANDLSAAKSAVLTSFPPISRPCGISDEDRKRFDEAVKKAQQLPSESLNRKTIDSLLEENTRLAKMLDEEKNETQRLRNTMTGTKPGSDDGAAKIISLFGEFKVKLIRDLRENEFTIIDATVIGTDSVLSLKQGDEGVCYGVDNGCLKVRFEYQGIDVLLDHCDVIHVPPQDHLTPAPGV